MVKGSVKKSSYWVAMSCRHSVSSRALLLLPTPTARRHPTFAAVSVLLGANDSDTLWLPRHRLQADFVQQRERQLRVTGHPLSPSLLMADMDSKSNAMAGTRREDELTQPMREILPCR